MKEYLVGTRPQPAPGELVSALVPPPHFKHATLASYQPNATFPSQGQARDAVAEFARLTLGRRRPARGTGLYLDGGFGVGKTHLLAALAHAADGRAAYGTFVEFTHLVGALGFSAARDALSEFRLVAIDEFELDDPGDTLLISRMMRELTDAGVFIAATSNTPPGALGQGRFAADDFTREIQALADTFTVVSIDGPDYRHREDLEYASPTLTENVAGQVVEPWLALVEDLVNVHPSKYGAYVDGIASLGLIGVAQLPDQARALRVVALVDRLYDRDVRISYSGVPIDRIFSADMLAGGYRKKYLRALSRLAAMVAPDGPAAF